MKVPEFLKDATNVYRTKNYIVKQLIGLEYDSVEGANLCSYDTFYLRTKARDAEYENFFRTRRCVNGKRLTTGLATRKYVQYAQGKVKSICIIRHSGRGRMCE